MKIHRITYLDATYLYADEMHGRELAAPGYIVTWGILREITEGHVDISTQWYGDDAVNPRNLIYLNGIVVPKGAILAIEEFDSADVAPKALALGTGTKDMTPNGPSRPAEIGERLAIKWSDIRTYTNGKKVNPTEMLLEGELMRIDAKFAYFKSPVNISLRTLGHHPSDERALGVYALPHGMIISVNDKNGERVFLQPGPAGAKEVPPAEAEKQALVTRDIPSYTDREGITYRHCFVAGLIKKEDQLSIEIAATANIGRLTESVIIPRKGAAVHFLSDN
ncbi:MAG TPA: hypothetical protein VGE62_03050 [Candidatus Paceibacterota bacterium]